MFPVSLSTLFICVMFLASGSVSGVELKVAKGDEVTLYPDRPINPPVNNITWKHKNNYGVVNTAIEWTKDGIKILHYLFKNVATIHVKTGAMMLKHADYLHGGEYTIEVDGKDRGEKFTLIVKDRVPKPDMKIELTDNPDVVHLRCEYVETITWRNSSGHILTGSKITPSGESITVTKSGNPKNFYTCTLSTDVSERSSDPAYEKDLFTYPSDGMASWLVAVIVLIVLGLIGGGIGGAFLMYKRNESFRKRVQRLPCFKDEAKKRKNNSADTTKRNEIVALSGGEEGEN